MPYPVLEIDWNRYPLLADNIWHAQMTGWPCLAMGGRVFPGVHHRAEFSVHDADDRVAVSLVSADGDTRVSVTGRVANQLPAHSIFPSVAAASAFFERGSLGYSPSREAGNYDGLELRTMGWQVAPLDVEQEASTFFEDLALFPSGVRSSIAPCSCATSRTSGTRAARSPIGTRSPVRADHSDCRISRQLRRDWAPQ